jgi:hypothetical protein
MYQLYIINCDIDKTSEIMKDNNAQSYSQHTSEYPSEEFSDGYLGKYHSRDSYIEGSSVNASSFLGGSFFSSKKKKNNCNKYQKCTCGFTVCECIYY